MEIPVFGLYVFLAIDELRVFICAHQCLHPLDGRCSNLFGIKERTAAP
jgi:hypothetical protein